MVLVAQTGTIDATFGENGICVMPHPDDWLVQGKALAIDTDGRYVVVGGHGSFPDSYLARVLPDAEPDADFGDAGSLSQQLSPDADWAEDVLVLPDGKFIAVGSAGDSLCVSQFQPNGDLDLTFGVGGVVRVGSSSGSSWGTSIVRRSDGRLIVAGMVGGDFAVVQLLADGDLDGSFGSGGVASMAFSSTLDVAYSLALRSNGSVVAVGRVGDWISSDALVMQFLSDGTLDPTFGTNGQLSIDLSTDDDMAWDVCLMPNGNAVICGARASTAFLACILPDGTLDEAFGDLGIALIAPGGGSTYFLSSIAIQSDGKLVAAGGFSTAGTGQLAVLRFLPDGSLDPTFGNNGATVHDIGEADGEGFYDVDISVGGTIVACGTAQYSGEDRAIVARFWSGLEVGLPGSSVEGTRLSVHPVPADDHATIMLGPGLHGPVRIEAVDGLGRVVQVLSSTAVSRQVELPTDRLMNGVYSIRCCIGAVCSDAKVIVSHGR